MDYLLAFPKKYDEQYCLCYVDYLDSRTFASTKECDTPISVLGSEISLNTRVVLNSSNRSQAAHVEKSSLIALDWFDQWQ